MELYIRKPKGLYTAFSKPIKKGLIKNQVQIGINYRSSN